MSNMTYVDLNAKIALDTQEIDFDTDKEAVRAYFLEHVNLNTAFFHSLDEKLDYMFKEGYYIKDVFDDYPMKFVKSLYKKAFDKKYRFRTFMGAFKFYTSYALKTLDGSRYLERYEDRVVVTALTLGCGNQDLATSLMEEMIANRFQPATPTFLNSGRARAGEPVSCFLMRVEDNMESIGRTINSALQLSKRGGGVGILLTNLRETGAPIKGFENQSSGIIPVMKILEDSFTYANQLGARQGAGAVYLNAHHPDIMRFLDTKRENADEKIRIKTMSLGVVIPDITMKLASKNEPMYLFSPYDVQRVYGKPFSEVDITAEYQNMVDNKNIRKTKISAREFMQTLAELQMESGYPYILFEDHATRQNPSGGKINMSNLCVDGESIISVASDPDGKNVADMNILELIEALKSGLSHNLYVKSWDAGQDGWYAIEGVHHKGSVTELIEVESGGKVLRCTPDHEIYTENRGWVKAQELVETDELVILD